MPDRLTPMPQALYAETYGGGLVCAMVMLVLYGLSLIQAYMYFAKYRKDHRALRVLVAVICVLGSVHAFFVCHLVYHYLVRTYTNPLMLVDGVWSVYTATLIGVLVCPIIQLFFVRTIYHLVGKPWRLILTVVLTVLIAAQLALGLFLCVREYQIWRLADLHQVAHIAMIPLFAVRVAGDAIIATTLCVCFYDAKTTVSSRRTMGMLNWLMVYAINRFVLTAAVVLAQMIILINRPDALWAMEFEYPIIHLYINSFLATLNARRSLRSKVGGTDIHTVTGADLSTVVSDIDFSSGSGGTGTQGESSYTRESLEGARSKKNVGIPLENVRGGRRVGDFSSV